MDKPKRISYLFILAAIVLSAWLHAAALLLSALFSYLALAKLRLGKRLGKWLAVLLFLLLLSGIGWGVVCFVEQAVFVLPKIVHDAVAAIVEWADDLGISLPFTDYAGLKTLTFDTLKHEGRYWGGVARLARESATQLLYLIVGCVVALSLFFGARLELAGEEHAVRNNLYSRCCEEVAKRFQVFYASFATVMGAQVVISAVNTVLSAIFMFAVGLPYVAVVVGVTFLCGLLPIVGNVLSNAVIVCIALTVSPGKALLALIYLVGIHKLEYFLNSKIVGGRIRNPLWLTLLALVVGERLAGVPGMILAPVVLYYVKVETAKVDVGERSVESPAGTGGPASGNG
jgi:predicted PurR-regulated permease PerM